MGIFSDHRWKYFGLIRETFKEQSLSLSWGIGDITEARGMSALMISFLRKQQCERVAMVLAMYLLLHHHHHQQQHDSLPTFNSLY